MKTAFKKLTALVLALCTAFCLTSCGNDENENQKYDVSIKIATDNGEEYIFTPDVSKMHVTRAYDGEEHRYYVKAWQCPDSPIKSLSENWLRPNSSGSNTFDKSGLYWDLDGKQHVVDNFGPLCIKEKGEYLLQFRTFIATNLWKFRTVNLYITVL